jgi:sortase A
MSKTLRRPALLVSLAAFVLAVLSFFPAKETRTVEANVPRETPSLLSESAPGLKAKREETPPPDGRKIRLTVPRLGLKNVVVPTGSTQTKLDREGILRLKDGGLPWWKGTNTVIVGHRLGYERTRVPYVFRRLNKMRPGDEVFVRDSAGRRYTFRVYDRMIVRPNDYWVTAPVEGRTVITLQTCTPIPTFENRLIVRAELAG